MDGSIKLNRLDRLLADLTYPVTRDDAESACNGVTLRLADGTEPLDAVIAASSADAFASPDDLHAEVMGLLPRHAVGEPYQSDGDA